MSERRPDRGPEGGRRPARAVRVGLVVSALVAAVLVAPAAASVVAPVPAREAAGSGYELPVVGARVVRGFEAPPQPWAAGHRGVDLAADVGGVVVAPQSGVVAFAGRVAGRPVVTVRHDDGHLTSLEPVTTSAAVGTRVTRGSPVGAVDDALGHCAPATCVHWGVRVAPERYVDPLTLVSGLGPVVLLPG
ncbi:M23 family metallopeptidase [Cellulomonas palmilytica]|uniref:M23 family metallopeptidase n=1 Tax=Cellulomonas palmilytica TaxID=2608402 RepID=UPI001F4569B8|nr:M23 family metallopeptidase [Cellulomonas palmilytica]UJP38675.1 M23 family metallopeptidase [Cellulomonas palmilytica]